MTWRTPTWAKALDCKINRLIEIGEMLVSAVQVEQTDLDTLASSLESVKASLSQEITDLEAKVAAGQPLAAGDLTGLQTALSDLQSLEPPVATPPADVPPADVPPSA